jgi:hypothetical protein
MKSKQRYLHGPSLSMPTVLAKVLAWDDKPDGPGWSSPGTGLGLGAGRDPLEVPCFAFTIKHKSKQWILS